MRALVFTVLDCGFMPRSAQEASDSGVVRLHKIIKIIGESRYGIHDISRTELDTINGLPRFNMPLELGIFFGAKNFGSKQQSNKVCLILDKEPHRYQKFISDIAGQDISYHANEVGTAIISVRNWLDNQGGDEILPAGEFIVDKYTEFCSKWLPVFCDEVNLNVDSLTFKNLGHVIKRYLKKFPHHNRSVLEETASTDSGITGAPDRRDVQHQLR